MVRIDDDYIVDIDAMGYTAKKNTHKKDKDGNTIYSAIGYYGSLVNAVKGIYEHKVTNKLSEGETPISEAIKILEELKQEMNMKLEGLNI
jgi:hypothetical protein